jgi:2'-5' RNA ligase
MRLFTAIDLSGEMLENMGEFLARLKPLATLRWTPVENLHITTKFIGEWPESRIGEMIAVLRTVGQDGILRAGCQPAHAPERVTNPLQAASLPHNGRPVVIAVRRVGWFPRVFWVGVEGGEPLAALARATEQAVAGLGVPVETRVYSPHLTLGRVKDKVRIEDLVAAAGNPDFGAFQATSFFLYLSANGKYSKLAEFSLNS